MKSPFKFLDAYTLNDKEIFFGRSEEIETLYSMVFRSSILLIYGFSGTGKTSLVQCGLASKFDGPEWYPFFIRKQSNINESLKNALLRATDTVGLDDPLPVIVQEIYEEYLSPVYLIFDQFEELFILGDEHELKTFGENIRDLINANLPCKIIFIIREEYLGNLYNLEKTVPALFNHKIRVEPMSNLKVKEVILSSFNTFNIELVGSNEERLQELVDNISEGKSGIQLPYLQVYLDGLYRFCAEKKIPVIQAESTTAADLPPLQITQADIQEFGKIDHALEDFLRVQQHKIQHQLKTQYISISDNYVRGVLDAFATEQGTKRPIRFSRNEQTKFITIDPGEQPFFPAIDTPVFQDCILALEQHRILRIENDYLELAHDSLAEIIDNQRTDEERQLNQLRKIILNNYENYLQFGEYLTPGAYLGIKNFIGKLKLTKDQLEFVQESGRRIDLEEKEKTKKSRRRLLIVSALGLISLLFALATLISNNRIVKANKDLASARDSISDANFQIVQEQLQSRKNKFEATLQSAINAIGKPDYPAALATLESAYFFASNQSDSSRIDSMVMEVNVRSGQSALINSLIARAELTLARGDEIGAIDLYNQAFEKGIEDPDMNSEVQQKMNDIQSKLASQYNESLQNAETLTQSGNCELAQQNFNYAQQTKPFLTEVQQRESYYATIKNLVENCIKRE